MVTTSGHFPLGWLVPACGPLWTAGMMSEVVGLGSRRCRREGSGLDDRRVELLGAGGPEIAETDGTTFFLCLGLVEDAESALGGRGRFISSVESEASMPRTSTTEEELT